MKRQYAWKTISEPRREALRTAEDIIDEYRAQGLTLTVRQLYYQHVARGLISNNDREYKKLGNLISDGRMAGLIDWSSIVDRTRFIRRNNHWHHPADIIEASANQFRYDLWQDQPQRVEVWIEKDALVGVIEGVCRELDVPYFSCRGYVSSSAMWRAGQRIGAYLDAGQKTTILHLGDHDPSGVQMTEDMQDRLITFTTGDIMHDALDAFEDEGHEDIAVEARRFFDERNRQELAAPTVTRIALTMDQVDEYQPPPNPAKLSDSRSGPYIERYGRQSWELDALEPTVLRDLIRANVEARRDQTLWDAAVARQTEAREALELLAERAREEL